MKLSVLMSVYSKESPRFLSQSLASLASQTLPAEEVVIVEDGPVGKDLEETIACFRKDLPIVSLQLPVNVGLGSALHAGLGKCRGEFVARMDSDDICLPGRFEKQLAFLECNPQVDVVGSAIAEFDKDCSAVHSVRRLPATNKALFRLASFRNPLNHVTVVFRRASVLEAGSYRPFPSFEDYHLWVRMLRRGCHLRNIDDVLVYVRAGNSMQARRGGFAYLRQELAFQKFLYTTGLLEAPSYLRNILVRAPLRLAPANVRSLCYNLFLRESVLPAGGHTVE